MITCTSTEPEMLILDTWKNVIETRLAELFTITDNTTAELTEAMRYATLNGGKRIRPLFTLASTLAVGGDVNKAVDAACAIEIIHCFSLIHDDLPAIDNDSLRRGKPTVHVAYGEAVALLAGDALLAKAFEILAHMNLDATISLNCIKEISKNIGANGLVGGETLDVLSEGKKVSYETVHTIHKQKTASLIKTACAVGAIIGGATPDELESIKKFGEDAGIAFQIKDDILNLTSTAKQLGKGVQTDITKEKATYPAICGLENSIKACEEYIYLARRNLKNLSGKTATLQHLAQICFDRSN